MSSTTPSPVLLTILLAMKPAMRPRISHPMIDMGFVPYVCTLRNQCLKRRRCCIVPLFLQRVAQRRLVRDWKQVLHHCAWRVFEERHSDHCTTEPTSCAPHAPLAAPTEGRYTPPASRASSEAFPPAAVVLTLTVSSVAKRSNVTGPPAFGPVPDSPCPPKGCTPTTAPTWLRLT